MSLGIFHGPVFSVRLVELPMPTGSRDPDVLLGWILDSLGLVRRRTEHSVGSEQFGALHRIMMDALLSEPLRGWDSNDLGDVTGLSNTGIHHQMVKLRECGLTTAQVEGKWHRHILRGGSMSSATSLMQAQANAVLRLRMSDLSRMVVQSETRMREETEGDEPPFTIRIAEAGPRKEEEDDASSLVLGLGLAGDSPRAGDSLARDILVELSSGHHPITLLALSERLSESRGRVSTVVERLRSSGIVERAPMLERLSQDVFAGIARQFDARGEEWLMTKGGLGRLEEKVSKALLRHASKGTLDTGKVAEILMPVRSGDQRVLLNTLGGRMPYGVRISGEDGRAVSSRVTRNAERVLRRIRTVAERLDESMGLPK